MNQPLDNSDNRVEEEGGAGLDVLKDGFQEAEKTFPDSAIHAAIARMSFGISPISLIEAYQDWLLHLLISPAEQFYMQKKAGEKTLRFIDYIQCYLRHNTETKPCLQPLPNDRRFRHEGWQNWPFNIYSQAFLLNQQWWHNVTTGVPGVRKQNENMVEFYSRQWLDMISPSNFILTNPEVLEEAIETGGVNFVHGFANFMDDFVDLATDTKTHGNDAFKVGETIATTPGSVMYRNELIELIQYQPTTDMVRPEPILITPAWIMKYYILDLSKHNSLVSYLVDQGFTVFVVSWVNPDASMRNTSFDDYRKRGLETALNVVRDICGQERIHAVGYCLGGTLLAIEAAYLARQKRDEIASLTLLAAQVDFKEAGELTLFINESQVSFLEDMMREKGYLDSSRMAGAFQLLRSQDLIWSRMIRRYLMGEEETINDLMAWNADGTRLPYRMHSDYLRKLFLNNDLAEGRYKVDHRPVYLEDIKTPTFVVATETDHVSPWRSVFKLNHLLDTEVTFLLTNGGHNAGIVSEPGHKGRHFRVSTHKPGEPHPHRDTWEEETEENEGSWWPQWVSWLNKKSSAPTKARNLHASNNAYKAIEPAPGSYVHQH